MASDWQRLRLPRKTQIKNRNSKLVLVGVPGLEPGTSSLSGTRSNQLSYTPQSIFFTEKMRPGDSTFSKKKCESPFRVKPPQNPSHSSLQTAWPVRRRLVELRGLEPLTSNLQSWRSSQLSYSPKHFFHRKSAKAYANPRKKMRPGNSTFKRC